MPQTTISPNDPYLRLLRYMSAVTQRQTPAATGMGAPFTQQAPLSFALPSYGAPSPGATMDSDMAGYASMDDPFIAANLRGYGQVNAPSPFGHNRDVFEANNPGYAGPYYNPSTGFYDAPSEQRAPWMDTPAQGAGGVYAAGFGAAPSYALPPSWDDQMAMLPSGGDSGGFVV